MTFSLTSTTICSSMELSSVSWGSGSFLNGSDLELSEMSLNSFFSGSVLLDLGRRSLSSWFTSGFWYISCRWDSRRFSASSRSFLSASTSFSLKFKRKLFFHDDGKCPKISNTIPYLMSNKMSRLYIRAGHNFT